MRDRKKLASPIDNPWDAQARATRLLGVVEDRDVNAIPGKDVDAFPGRLQRTRVLDKEVTLYIVRKGIEGRAVYPLKLPSLRNMASDLGVKVMTLSGCIHRLSKWGEDFSLISKARRKLKVRLWAGERVPELEAQLRLEDEEARASEPVHEPVQEPVQTGPLTGNMKHAYISREEEREQQEIEAAFERKQERKAAFARAAWQELMDSGLSEEEAMWLVDSKAREISMRQAQEPEAPVPSLTSSSSKEGQPQGAGHVSEVRDEDSFSSKAQETGTSEPVQTALEPVQSDTPAFTEEPAEEVQEPEKEAVL